MDERRPERVGHLVQAELGRWFLREAKDPRLHDVTVTGVRMSADLRIARVYVRHLGAADVPALLAALRHAAPVLRGAVARALALRVAPELRFEYDAAPDRAERIGELLRGARQGRDDEDET